MKTVIIGAGSTYTPEVVYGILKSKNSPIREIVLMDIRKDRLSPVVQYCRALSHLSGAETIITESTDLESVLPGAGFIVTQIRVGGNERRRDDEEKALEMGWLAQETTGAVGFLKAFRTIPVMVDIVRNVEKYCPNAFLINFTNPAGIVSTAIQKATGKKNMVGLCNVPIFLKKQIIRIIEDNLQDLADEMWESDEEIRLDWGGLNHLSWVFDVTLSGRSILGRITDFVTSDKYDPLKYFPLNQDHVRRTGAIPSPYLRYFTDMEKAMAEQREKGLRGSEVMEIEEELQEIYREEALNITGGRSLEWEHYVLPAELSKRGGADYSRLAVKLIHDIIKGASSFNHILNVPDREEFFVKDGKFCEVPVRFEKKGTETDLIPTYPRREIPDEIRNLIAAVNNYENLTIESALKQDFAGAEKALTANPLVSEKKIPEFLKWAFRD